MSSNPHPIEPVQTASKTTPKTNAVMTSRPVRSRPAPRLTPEQQEVWDERMAICVIDGGLTEQEAEVIAWDQICREFGPPVVPSSPGVRVAKASLTAPVRSSQENHHVD